MVVIVGTPLEYNNGGLVPNTVSALEFKYFSTEPYKCEIGAPVRDLQRLAGTTLISGLRVPPGATYACALPAGGGWQFYDDNAKFQGQGIGGFGRDTGNVDANGEIIPTAATCSGVYGFFATPAKCIGRTLSVVIGSALVSVTAWLLAAAGLLFNVLIDHTIISFGYLFTPEVGVAIGTAWGAFRDIANIVIIGMFVFIAVNMILGVKEFGEKKKVAQVLIIAVLLNFSLLFTKIIIDASNFTAMQFYKASELSTGVTDKETLNNFATFSKKGISGRFIDLMGLGSLAETSNALTNAAFGTETNNYTTANGWLALLFGFLAATLLLAAAVVLLYGCLLLLTRAILLILLMLTSALAFASWLIPHHFIEQGWMMWWKSLLKTAFFAPILMAMLWATLLVAEKIKPVGGALGSLAKDPTKLPDLNVLFSYLIIIGLLFASFKTARSFSHSISGFAATQSALGTGLRLATAAGLTYVASSAQTLGFLGRNTIGKYAGKGFADLTRARTEERSRLFGEQWGKLSPAQQARWERRGMGPSSIKPRLWERAVMGTGAALGKSTFDATRTGLVKKAMQAVGAVNFAPEMGKGGYVGVKERQAAAALERARDMGYESERETRSKAEEAARDRQADERRRLDAEEAAHKNTHDNAESARGGARSAKQAEQGDERAAIAAARRAALEETARHEEEANEERTRHTGIRDDLSRQIRETEENIARARSSTTGGGAVPTVLTDRLGELVDQRKSADEAMKSIIAEKRAAAQAKKDEAEQYDRRKAELDKEVEDAGKAAVDAVRNTANANLRNVETTRKALDQAAKDAGIFAGKTVSAEAVGAQSAHTRFSTLYGLIGTPETDPAATRIKKAARKHERKENALAIKAALTDVDVNIGGGTPSTAPRTAPTPPTEASGGHST